MSRLIDADALKQLTTKRNRIWDGVTDSCGRGLTEIIDSLPTIDPVKHGRWVLWDLSWGQSVWSCSECEEATEVPTEMGDPIYKFCPNCGADMRGEEDE